MQVMKFGGAVLKSINGFVSMLDILKNYGNEPLLIVISAFSKSTTQLRTAAITAETGLENKSYKILDTVIEENTNFYKTLLKDNENIERLNIFFKKATKEIRSLLKGISITREVTPRTMDLILSYGEYFALRIVSEYLSSQNFVFEIVNAADVIVSNDNYGSATPIIEKTRKNVAKFILPALKSKGIVLTQGFVARTESGEISTMGMESSNLTAAVLANMLEASSLVVWTDVEGFRSADPKIIVNTKPIPKLSYQSARFLSLSGMKLLYPSMLDYLEEKGIKLIYKSAFVPDGEFTEISNLSSETDFSIIIHKSNLVRTSINDIIHKDISNILYEVAKANSIYFMSLSNTGMRVLTTKKVQFSGLFNVLVERNISFISYVNIGENKYSAEDILEDGVEIHLEESYIGNVLRIICPDAITENIIKRIQADSN